MQRKRKRMGRKEIFCILLCIMMIVGTAFSAAAQSADRESAESSAAGFQGSGSEASDSGDTDPDVSEEQNVSNSLVTEELNLEQNGNPEISEGSPDDDREDRFTDGDSESSGEEKEGDRENDKQDNEEDDVSLSEGGTEDSAGSDELAGTDPDGEDAAEEEGGEAGGGTGEGGEGDEGDEGEDEEDEEGGVSWYDPTKNTYEISSAQQLTEFAYLINQGITTFSKCTLTLTEDIDLSGTEWESAGFSSSYSFAGTFDGGGHTIKNMTLSGGDMYIGLFGYVRGEVKNLAMENVYVAVDKNDSDSAAKIAVGSVAGYCTGSVSGVEISGSVILSDAGNSTETYLGGVAGYCAGLFSGVDASVTVTADCALDGILYMGGAVGRSAGGMSDVTVRGSITSEEISSSADKYVGGAAGYAEGAEFSALVNEAAVTAASSGDVYAGGAGGYVAGADQIINSGNTAEIIASSYKTSYAGGLAGMTSAGEIRNCFNQNSVKSRVLGTASGALAYAGGLAGTIGDCAFYNCYGSSSSISGSSGRYGILAGVIDGSGAAVCNYVYWPGSSAAASVKMLVGDKSTAVTVKTNCMGIDRISDRYSSTLEKRLNAQSVASYVENARDNLYMWKVPEGGGEKDAPVFRTEALYPIFPAVPVLSVEQPVMALHAKAQAESEETGNAGSAEENAGSESGSAEENAVSENGSTEENAGSESGDEYSCEPSVSVVNSDSLVTLSCQWQVSEDGESYAAYSGEGNDTFTCRVDAGEAGIKYYRLRIICSADYADTSKTVYSDAIKVVTGWKVSFADGGMSDGSGAVTGASLPDPVFPVIPADGALSLKKAESAGNYFLGWSLTYEDGQVFDTESLLDEYDASAIEGDVKLYAVFRKAGSLRVTLDKGPMEAQLKEGVEAENLMISLDEGSEFVMPDGNDYFTYEGYRFMGWHAGEVSGSSEDLSGSGGDTGTSDLTENDDESDTAEQKLYEPGDVYLAGNGYVTLTAVWSRLYDVTFSTGVSYGGSSASGGVQGELPESFQAVEGEMIVLPSADGLSYEGHLFRNWKLTYTDSEEQTKTFYVAVGASYTMPAYDVTAEAQWVISYTVKFSPGSRGDAVITGEVPEPLECFSGANITLPGCTLERAGYIMTGWYDTVGDYAYAPGETFGVYYNTTFQAIWKLEHEVYFRRGSIEGEENEIAGEEPEPVIVADGNTVILPENTFIPPDAGEGYYYRFVGWKLSGDDFVYNPGASAEIVSDQRNIVFTAVWKKTVIWNGAVSESFAAGDGTEEAPYEISTAEELAKLQSDVNAGTDYEGTHFILTEDIDLNKRPWTPIGEDSGSPFCGSFDGNGKTVSSLLVDAIDGGIEGYAGFFGCGEDAEILDLELEVEIDVAGQFYEKKSYHGMIVGGVIGKLDGGTVRGCRVSGSIQGLQRLTQTGLSEQYCIGYIGGIVGYAGENTFIENCVNEANLSGEAWIFGGIVAQVDDSSAHPAYISGCRNSGKVENRYIGCNISGGIAGAVRFGDIAECTNEGNVSSFQEVAYLGGIAGLSSGDVEKCFNAGNVVHNYTEPNDEFATSTGFWQYAIEGSLSVLTDWANTNGGIVGGMSQGKLSFCENRGEIYCGVIMNVNGGVSSYQVSSGGIAGIISDVEISDCINSSDVASICKKCYLPSVYRWENNVSAAGGIVGDVCGESTITRCLMLGTASSDSVDSKYEERFRAKGLILGSVHDGHASIVSCYALDDSSGTGICFESTEMEGAVTTENSFIMAQESFYSGAAAYLLGYSGLVYEDNGSISEDKSGRKDLGTWTQRDGYPALIWDSGESVVPVRVDTSGADGVLTLGNSYCSGLDVIYAVPGSKIYVTADVNDTSQKITERTETETVEDGTWYYTYEDVQENAFQDVTVLHVNKSGEQSSLSVDGKEFTLQDCWQAIVQASLDQTVTSKLVSSQFVKKEELVAEPETGEGSGSGGGKGSGSGAGTGSGTQPGTGKGEGKTPSGGENNGSGKPGAAAPNIPVLSDNPSSSEYTLITVPAAAENSVTEPEAAEQPQAVSEPDSGGGGSEPEEPAEEEPAEEDVTMFEVIQDTVADNPFIVILLLLLVVFLIAAAGFRRYRKQRQ